MRVLVTHVGGYEAALQGVALTIGVPMRTKAGQEHVEQLLCRQPLLRDKVLPMITAWFYIEATRAFWKDMAKFSVKGIGVIPEGLDHCIPAEPGGHLYRRTVCLTYEQLVEMQTKAVPATGPEFREFLVSFCVLPYAHLLAPKVYINKGEVDWELMQAQWASPSAVIHP